MSSEYPDGIKRAMDEIASIVNGSTSTDALTPTSHLIRPQFTGDPEAIITLTHRVADVLEVHGFSPEVYGRIYKTLPKDSIPHKFRGQLVDPGGALVYSHEESTTDFVVAPSGRANRLQLLYYGAPKLNGPALLIPLIFFLTLDQPDYACINARPSQIPEVASFEEPRGQSDDYMLIERFYNPRDDIFRMQAPLGLMGPNTRRYLHKFVWEALEELSSLG